MSLSSDRKYLCTVGQDDRKRELIIIWHIQNVVGQNIKKENRQLEIVAKQLSDFNILSVKFSPVDNEKLVRINIFNWLFEK